jgi:chorismate synthase
VDCYVGDYDYASALVADHITAWADGRIAVSGQSQQNTFFDKEPAGGGGGGIPCGDLVSFEVRCKVTAGGHKLQARLTLTDTSHSGEQVTITVDGNPNQVTINGDKAQLQIDNPAPGAHTVELTDPAGCFPPSNPSCN